MDLTALADRIWYGDDRAASAARAALTPLSFAFGVGASVREGLYDRGRARVHPLAIPAVSVGNLTVGGTGKTPMAAWCARRLADRGARPALVLRGVGDDETRVHELLNPDVPVIATADRVAGAMRARDAGADVAVLDDAFQHRRASRVVDLVLLAAEQSRLPPRVLPAGPYREGPAALRRASAVIVTRKSASRDEAETTLARVMSHVRGGAMPPHALVQLVPDALHAWAAPATDAAADASVAALRGASVLAVSGIGNPHAFAQQLATVGAVVQAVAYPDHHRYTARDAESIARRAGRVDRVVCTLKDAVKLGPLWPRGAPTLWYVSQRVTVERGEELLHGLLERVLAARTTASGMRTGLSGPGARPDA